MACGQYWNMHIILEYAYLSGHTIHPHNLGLRPGCSVAMRLTDIFKSGTSLMSGHLISGKTFDQHSWLPSRTSSFDGNTLSQKNYSL